MGVEWVGQRHHRHRSQACDLHVTCIKIDLKLNTNGGTMSPFDYGIVFVLDGGA
ncbi:putative CTP synthase (glutamine hydrolyzing) [Rosa chinensis]|uniref:Putative CTP synthase (Glutamine hydrolyzing) n=1 Tax=Rosa chinensis TaxID=74649 RepID=A0A2P6S1L7_ROSCH|nr:putative CTP synthase (glutamine hydrolyzing) [Rosa chinensis]